MMAALLLLLSITLPGAPPDRPPLVAVARPGSLMVTGCWGDVYLRGTWIGSTGGEWTLIHRVTPPVDAAYRWRIGDAVTCVAGGDVPGAQTTRIVGARRVVLPVISGR